MEHVKVSRRRIIGMLSIGVGGALLSACGATATPAAAATVAGAAVTAAAQAPTAASGEGKVTVTLWSSFSGANGEADTALAKQFNDTYDDIHVDLQYQGSYEETAQKLTAALQAKTAPEISILSDVWWFKFYINRALLPLDDLLTAQGTDLSDYQDSLINEGLRQGKHYWIPFARSTPLLYYNQDLWAEAGLPERGPDTWAEFSEWAPKLVKKEGDEMKVSAFAHPDGASYIAWLFQAVVWQFGGKYSDADFTMHMTSEDTVRAGQFYSDTVHSLGWASVSKDPATDFVNGLTAATMLSTGSMGGIRGNMKAGFGTAYLPKERNFGCCTGGAGYAILAGSAEEKRAAAMAYIAFASSPESTTYWAQQTGYMPVRKSALESEEMQAFFADFPQFKTATEQLALTQPQDAARVFVPNGDQIIGKGLEKVTIEQAVVQEAMAEVQATLESEAKPVVEALRAVEG
ncbi:MAG: ABC transporter substrate-binding protein [Anaerolineae bacterium]